MILSRKIDSCPENARAEFNSKLKQFFKAQAGSADSGAAIQSHFIKLDTNGDQLGNRKEIKFGLETKILSNLLEIFDPFEDLFSRNQKRSKAEFTRSRLLFEFDLALRFAKCCFKK